MKKKTQRNLLTVEKNPNPLKCLQFDKTSRVRAGNETSLIVESLEAAGSPQGVASRVRVWGLGSKKGLDCKWRFLELRELGAGGVGSLVHG